ncbi:MAG: hypothetical protein CR991_07235 [Proteobacteria bacterium]|nr:MAG: hypothetical protein CR991_07235 [Pseudomonadota bacterium]
MAKAWIFNSIVTVAIFIAYSHVNYFILALLLIMSLFAVWQAFKYMRHKKQAVELINYMQQAPITSPDMYDCYVRMEGELLSVNTLSTPYSQQTCSLFVSKVLGIWESKRKKPSKGYETVKSKLQQQISEETVWLKNNEVTVKLNMPDFLETAYYYQLHNYTEKSISNPLQQPIPREQRKYKHFQIIEQWAKEHDKLTAFGKLVRRGDELELVATHSENHPTVLMLGSAKMVYNFLEKTIDKKYPLTRYFGMTVAWSFSLVIVILFLWVK